MRIVLLVTVSLLLGITAFAGSEQIIKQRAKDLRDQNNARQGVPAPAPRPTPAAANPAAPTTTVITMTPQQQAMLRLQNALAAVRPDARLTTDQKKGLTRDLAAAAMGANKPSAASLSKLSDSLMVALSEKLMSTATRKRLLQNLEAALNPGKMSAGQITDVVSDVKSLFENTGIAKDHAAAVAEAVKDIAAETRKSAVK